MDSREQPEHSIPVAVVLEKKENYVQYLCFLILVKPFTFTALNL